MNPTAFQQFERTEAAEIRRWRLDQLVGAGYDADNARLLAGRVEIDLHLAVKLVEQGCPPPTAVRILL